VITGLLVVLLVSVFAASTKDAFDRKQAADRLLLAVHTEQDILDAKQYVRAEWSTTNSAFAVPEGAVPQTVNASTRDRIALLHSKIDRAFKPLDEEFKTRRFHSDTTGLTQLLKARAIYDRRAQALAAVFQQPTGENSKRLLADWQASFGGLANALNKQADVLSRTIVSDDLAVNELIAVNKLAWDTAVEAGSDRRTIAAAIAENRRPSADTLRQFDEANGSVNAFWTRLESEDELPALPSQLKASFRRARDVYFIRFRATRNKIVENLASGKQMPTLERDWLNMSNPALESITDISKIALDLTEAHAAEQAATAVRNFYIAIALMFLSIGLASFATMYVMWWVIKPLIRGMAVPTPPESDQGHFHIDYSEFWYIMEGKMTYKIEGVPVFTADQGDVMYAPHGRFHRTSFAGDGVATRLAIFPLPGQNFLDADHPSPSQPR
jgi:mannose-6-phosphate isomerase-like protein (cupin superfamily)